MLLEDDVDFLTKQTNVNTDLVLYIRNQPVMPVAASLVYQPKDTRVNIGSIGEGSNSQIK